MGLLTGQVALVTGGNRGLGRAIALEFAREGATVIAASRSGAPPEGLPSIPEPGRILSERVDVSHAPSVHALLGRIIDAHATLDVVVANAGVDHTSKVADLPLEHWDAMLATNLTGTLNTLQAAIPHMLARGGRILTMSSSMATRPTPGTGAYAATKAAIEALTKVTALEVARHGILVNCLAPGVLDEGMGRQLVDSKVWDTYVKHFAQRRPGTVREAARAAVFLVGPDASYVNGTVFPVDGGLSWA